MVRRIAHVISTPRGIGGAERVLEALVAGGLDRGDEIVVLNPFDEQPETSALRGLFDARYRARRRRGLAGVVAARRWLRRELESFRPDIVHAHLFQAEVLVASLPGAVAPVKVLSQHHGDYFRWLGRRWLHRVDGVAERRFDAVVPCSHAVAAIVVHDFGVEPARVHVVHNGWRGSPRARECSDGSRGIACVANLRREKDHDTLLHAFRLVVDELPDATLDVIGDGPRRDELRMLANDLGLGANVTFAGAVPDVWPRLEAADLFALSSAFEPLGIAIIEAMAAGLPVVATSVGGIPELVDDGVNGRLVGPRDAHALASAVSELLRDVERRRSMGCAAKARADSLRIERMVDAYHAVYDEVAA